MLNHEGMKMTMDVNVLMIDELLNMSKNRVRKATERDVLNIKNEMLLLLNDKFNTEESTAIRTLINELHYLNVYVEKEDEHKIIYSYEPPKFSPKKLTIKEAGWIKVDK